MLLTCPSKKAVAALKERLREEWRQLVGQSAETVIRKLNPILLGWANYFRIGASNKAFHAIDHYMFQRACRYAQRTHPRKSRKWRDARYFGALNPQRPKDRWVFGDKATGHYLAKLGWVAIRRHVKVKGAASPDDPDLADYWAKRRNQIGALALSLSELAKRQNYRCPICWRRPPQWGGTAQASPDPGPERPSTSPSRKPAACAPDVPPAAPCEAPLAIARPVGMSRETPGTA